MDSLLLSRLSKDFLNSDPDVVASKARYRMGWAGSVLASHPKATGAKTEKAKLLLGLREHLAGLFREEKPKEVSLSTSPKLPSPAPLKKGTYQPFRYFSKGVLDNDKKKTPEPIRYLLIETNEQAQARPVPGSTLLIRSLCKGKGVLKQNKQGLVFLDIDNRFIGSLLPYLKAYGLVRPPYFNLFALPDGAHIPVIPHREVEFQYLNLIEELGKEFTFEIEGLYSVEPSSWPEVEQVWFFKVKSEGLEKLRRKYFLPAIPNGHPFHIAVAVKQRALTQPNAQPSMRINIAFIAA